MKKAIIAGTSIATMALMAMPALAGTRGCCDSHHRGSCCPKVEIGNETVSKVKTINVTAANSGLNGSTQIGGLFNDASIKTALSIAISDIEVATGSSKVIVEAPKSGQVEVDNLGVSKVKTMNITAANSGLNKTTQINGLGSKATIDAGGAQAQSTIGVYTGDTITVVK